MKNIIKIKTSDLTDEQKMIYHAKIEVGKNISIKGGPGTGKTTILFKIAEKIRDSGKEFRIITLQNNLKNFLKDSFGDLDEHVRNAWGTNKPKDNPDMRGVMYDLANYYKIPFPGGFFNRSKNDKDDILKKILENVKNDLELKKKSKNTIILIDEAQDLPLLYFSILNELFNTIYIFGDDNQKINDWGTEMNKIEKILGITIIDTYFNENFRNAKQIYKFAELTGFKRSRYEVTS